MKRLRSHCFFDFDGLILDTESPEVRAWRELFAELGVPYDEGIWKAMIGQSTPAVSDLPWRALERALGSVDRFSLEPVVKQRRLDLIAQEAARPGVADALSYLESIGVVCAVVSSSGRSWVEGHLDRLGLLDRFQPIVCGHEGLPSKPAPDLYLRALELCSIEASGAAAIEDSPNGIAAGKAARLWVVSVPNSLTAQLDLSRADLNLDSLEQFGRLSAVFEG